ncbi:stomatin-like isoform X2 [Boleophthalmus pectinirostris]|uniref:stomatin-like isoform X2 n=1 Tax=Boleophthalmus pectinirostris TaxID=150288 RepID=UPI00243152ED|nr:stomatin-like isoform X2 [Boleophthalmus pectinirostris]
MFGRNKVGVLRTDPENVENIPTDGGRRQRGVLEVLGAVITALSLLYIALTFPVTIWGCARIIQEYERAVIFRLGRLIKGKGVKGPGLFWIIPWLDEIQTVDLRTVCIDVEPQEVLTADSVPLQVDAVLFYRVVEPVLWVTRAQDGPLLTRLLAQTSLRATVGSHSLSQIITQRRSMAQKMEEVIGAASRPWGVRVQRVELRGLVLPVDLLRCMALEAEAQRVARAKLISAEAELGASLALQRAASALSPVALQLRYLQSLSSVHSSASVIVTAVPMEILRKLTPHIT